MSAAPETAAVVVPKPAATLILLRDSAAGPELLMLKRSGLSDVLGHAFVFPGGKLDAADLDVDPATALDEGAAVLARRLGEAGTEPALAAGLFVAAMREAFEESGVLLACEANESIAADVAALVRNGSTFAVALAECKVRLASSQLLPWTRWITPVTSLQAKRFDTRFFIARAPRDAQARHDGHETTEAVWMRPRDALERYWAGGIALAPPQIMSLVELTPHADVDSALAAAAQRAPPLIQPLVLKIGEGSMLCYPGDAEHPVATRAMPGPLRLAMRNGRFEPVAGFDAFFE